jgi:hypothetical protein
MGKAIFNSPGPKVVVVRKVVVFLYLIEVDFCKVTKVILTKLQVGERLDIRIFLALLVSQKIQRI